MSEPYKGLNAALARNSGPNAEDVEARHPEDYCHRCQGPNISWFTPGGVWDPVMRPIPGEPWKWNEIICPLCFVELAGGGTWALLPLGADGGPWTSADERKTIVAAAEARGAERGARAVVEAVEAAAVDMNPVRVEVRELVVAAREAAARVGGGA